MRKIELYKVYDFSDFINTLSHEYGHFIDDNFPDMGMLGAQIAYNGFEIYASSDEDYGQYRVNPTEASSFKIGEIVGRHIEKVLIEEGIKRYDYLKTHLAALGLKKDKALKQLTTLRRNILAKRGLLNIVTILPTKMQQAIFRKLEKGNPALQKAGQLRDETWHKYYWFKEFVSEIDQTIQERAEKQKILSHRAR